LVEALRGELLNLHDKQFCYHMVKSNPLGHMGSIMQRKGIGGGMDFRDLKTFDLSHKGGFIQIITSKNIFKIFHS
jgi:hypothetical protein